MLVQFVIHILRIIFKCYYNNKDKERYSSNLEQEDWKWISSRGEVLGSSGSRRGNLDLRPNAMAAQAQVVTVQPAPHVVTYMFTTYG